MAMDAILWAADGIGKRTMSVSDSNLCRGKKMTAQSITCTATARNFSEDSENRLHSDAAAARFGFQGALVPGSAVFGHMARPLVEALGEGWLSGHRVAVRFFKPAYHGDRMTIAYTPTGSEHFVACSARGERLAELRSQAWRAEVCRHSLLLPGTAVQERPDIHWRNLAVDEPFPAWTWTPDEVANAEAAAQVEDDLPCYRQGTLHPHAILDLANRAFTRRYRLAAWLHVGSEVRFRKLLKTGEEIEVRCVPTRKWRRKGHEFVDLRVALLTAGEVATEIRHTAIFGLRRR